MGDTIEERLAQYKVRLTEILVGYSPELCGVWREADGFIYENVRALYQAVSNIRTVTNEAGDLRAIIDYQIYLPRNFDDQLIEVTTDDYLVIAARDGEPELYFSVIGVNLEMGTHLRMSCVKIGGLPFNVALAANGATATATNHFLDNVPSRAIDGDVQTFYHSASELPITFEVDFEQERRITQVILKIYRSDYPGAPSSNFNFGYSLDYFNGVWVNIVSGEQTENIASATIREHFFAAVLATKVRLVSVGNCYVEIQEFEVIGSEPES